jgi:hypothetical protein
MRQVPGRLLGVLAALLVPTSLLISAPSAGAATCCGGAAPALTEQAVADFKAHPERLLTQNPVGGGALISRVRDLLLADSTSLSAVLGLLPSANNDQKSAIATGLAQAARLWVRGDPSIVQQIQEAVAGTKDSSFILAYTVAAGNPPTGPVGGNAAGSAGGPGGQTAGLGTAAGGGSGGAEGIGGRGGVNTGGFSITGSTTGTSITTTSSTTVSP